MSLFSRYVAGFRASALSFFREPLNLALLFVLPAASIQIFGVAYGQFPEFGFLNLPASLTTTAKITGATFATGTLAGVLGLFQLISARDADHRLSICGFPALDLLVSRFVTLVVISLVIAGVSTLTLLGLMSEPVASPLFVFGGLTLVGIIYAMLGMLIGAVLPRALEGSLALVILADMDNVIASEIFQIQDRITQLSPTSYGHEIVTRAVLEGELATGELLPALTIVTVLGGLAVLAYTHTVKPVASGGVAQ
jgi:ABC-2 type transport system permease protein